MYFFQSLEFFWTCFARSTLTFATTCFTIWPTSTPRISRKRYFIRSLWPGCIGESLRGTSPYKTKLSTVPGLRMTCVTSRFEGVDPAVARGDRNPVFAAQVDGGSRPLERGHEDLGRVLVRHESRRFKGIHQIHQTPPLQRTQRPADYKTNIL